MVSEWEPEIGQDVSCAPLRLAVLDVDGTLKLAESPYQYLHDRLGVALSAWPNSRVGPGGVMANG